MAQIYFGTTSHAEWVACPKTGANRNKSRYASVLEFENSGADVVQSAPFRNNFQFDFPIQDATKAGMLEPWKRFYAGEYGLGPYYFYDPMYADYNLFGAQWAAPGLIEQGWKSFGSTEPTFGDTPVNSYGKPVRTAIFTLSGTANTPDGKVFTFLVPTGYTLHLGASGSVTGNGALVYLPVGGSQTTIALSSAASAPAFSATVNGTTANSVTVYITRTAANPSSITLISMWAQILPTGQSPVIPRHLPGEGTTGLKFSNDVVTEPYIMADQHFVGMNVELIEVEQWL